MDSIEDGYLVITPVSHVSKDVIATLKSFDCADSFLNEYARTRLVKNDHRNLAKGFVAIRDNRIVGYITTKVMTLGREHFDLGGFPHAVPTVSIEQVATDINYRNQQIGSRLTRKAFEIALAASRNTGIKGISLWSHPRALEFYRKLGFQALKTKQASNTLELTLLFLPIETLQRAVE